METGSYFKLFERMLDEASNPQLSSVDRDELAWRRKEARDGNPFPFIAYQWPLLVAGSKYYEDFFEGKVGDSENPCLLLESWQREIIKASVDGSVGEIAIAGCTGAGKGAVVGGICINMLFDIHQDCRIHITSETYDHAKTNMFREFCIWRDRMQFPCQASIGIEGASDGHDKYIKILNPQRTSGEAFSGRHGSNSIYVFDESSALPLLFKENADKNATKIFALSNPRVMNHWFRDMFGGSPEKGGLEGVLVGYRPGSRSRMLCVTIGGPDCSNVKHNRLKTPVAPRGGIVINGNEYRQGEMIPQEDYEQVRPLIPNAMDLAQFRMTMSDPEKWKRDCFGLGLFIPEDLEKQIILKSHLKFHFESHAKFVASERKIQAFAFDPSRSTDGDDSVLVAGNTDGVDKLYSWKAPTYQESATKIIDIAWQDYGIDLKLGGVPVVIDFGGGYGAGVAEWLRSKGVWVYEFHPSASAAYFPREYVNLRAEAYCLLGRRFNPSDYWEGTPWAIPYSERLEKELTAPTKIHPAGDDTRFGVEPKLTIKQKLNGASPDFADSVVMLYYYIFELNQYYAVLGKINGSGMSYPQEEDLGQYFSNNEGIAGSKTVPGETLESYFARVYKNLMQ